MRSCMESEAHQFGAHGQDPHRRVDPAILPHPVTQIAMHANWYGLAGDELQEALTCLNDNEILGGIVGSKHDHHTAPYALTEEFVSVYRMHPLIPDEVEIRSLANDAVAEKIELPDLAGIKAPGVVNRIGMSDLFYSFGRCPPRRDHPAQLPEASAESPSRQRRTS